MNFEDLEFDTESMTDEEIEEMLNAEIDAIAESAEVENNKTGIVNPDRIQQVLYTYKVAKLLTKGVKGAKVSYKLYEPYKSMGVVSVSGKNLIFKKSNWFIKAVELADNFEVYPKTDGTVQMNFTFHGLTKTIE